MEPTDNDSNFTSMHTPQTTSEGDSSRAASAHGSGQNPGQNSGQSAASGGLTFQLPATLEWARSRDGWISGVCTLFARRLKLGVMGVRLIWALTFLLLGSGAVSYFVLAVGLPLEGDVEKAYRPRFLGVCRRIAIRTGNEVGLIRVIAVLSMIVSAGLTVVLYFILSVLMPRLPASKTI